jgi:hypothetical protein
VRDLRRVKAVEDAPEKFPPDEWFAAVADGRRQRVAFLDMNGETEFVHAEWSEENIFELVESPLLVDGVSYGDSVEVEWREGELDPHFTRLYDRLDYRTIRAYPAPKEVKRFLSDCERHGINGFRRYRYERGVSVTSISPDLFKYYLEEAYE